MEFQKTRSDDFDYENIAMDNDSVLGDQTEERQSQILPQISQIPPANYNATTTAPYAYNRDTSNGTGGRPTDMAYVGDTDDVSTLANDTVSERHLGSITQLFPSMSIKKKGGNTTQLSGPQNSQNYQGYSNDDGNDDDENLKQDSVDEQETSFKNLKYFIAMAFALFLVGAITALSVGFLNLQDQDESYESTQRSFDEGQLLGDFKDWTFKPTQEASSPPTVSASPSFSPTTASPSSIPSTSVPSSSPSTSAPSVVPSIAPTPTVPTTSPPTGEPSRSPSLAPSGNHSSKPSGMSTNSPSIAASGKPSSKTSSMPSSMPMGMPSTTPSYFPSQAPGTPLPTLSATTSPPTMSPTTSPPTQKPTPAPTMTKEEVLQTVLGAASPDVLGDTTQPGSKQKEVYDWLISDPDFYSYSADRLLQRYALGVFSLKISGNRRRLALDYSTTECDWFPPQDGSNACDGEGIRQNIVLRDQYIDGTLPTEVYMLDKLKTLILPNAMIFGMIPDSIKGMKSLRVLDLNNNRLSGPLPDKIGDLKKLRILDMSNNALMGELPTSFGKLKDARQVLLNGNLINGPIPADIRKMKNLASLDLRNNRLTGSVPLEMMEMVKLQELQLTANFLTGVIESSFCLPLVDLAVFTTDCEAGGTVTCNCCTSCGSGVSQASVVVAQSASIQIAQVDGPNLRGAVQQSPSLVETLICENKVEVIKRCYESGNDIRVHFTNCDAEGTDWIGLYDSNADPENLGEPLLWLETCGTQDCGVAKGNGSVYFDKTVTSGASWPIAEGAYKAFLVRKGSHESFAESGEILVQGSC